MPLLLWDYTGWVLYGRQRYGDEFAMHFPPALRWMFWLKENWPYASGAFISEDRFCIMSV